MLKNFYGIHEQIALRNSYKKVRENDMSNRLFQGVIHQMRDAIDRTIGVMDETSVIIACSELGRIGEVNESVNAETMASTDTFVLNGILINHLAAVPNRSLPYLYPAQIVRL